MWEQEWLLTSMLTVRFWPEKAFVYVGGCPSVGAGG